ncbi:MAG: UvrB/UvrC motif-containing protein [Planctomycetota bacterium]
MRQRRPKGAKVFGPFPSGASLNATLKVLRAAGGIRTCSNADYNNRSRPCLEYEIGHCKAPCVGLQSVAEYQAGVRDVLDFLRGKTEPILSRLRANMDAAAEVERYEEAARWRDRIAALERTAEGQRVVDPDGHDRDVFGWHRNGPRVTVAVLQVRDGTLVSSRRFHFQSDLGDAELGSAVAGQLYTRDEPPPGEVLLPAEPSDAEPLAAWLSEKRGSGAAAASCWSWRRRTPSPRRRG